MERKFCSFFQENQEEFRQTVKFVRTVESVVNFTTSRSERITEDVFFVGLQRLLLSVVAVSLICVNQRGT